MITVASYLNGLPRSIDHDRKKLGKFIVVDVGVGEGSCILYNVLEVDIAGGREVPLIGVCELHVLGLITCVGCDIVQADHAPEAGGAQGIFHGILVRHHGRIQEEVEEGLEEEVERRVKRTLKNKCACRWPWMETKTHRRDLSHMWRMNTYVQCIYRRCAACSELRCVHVSVQCDVHAIGHSALRIVEVVREDIRSVP